MLLDHDRVSIRRSVRSSSEVVYPYAMSNEDGTGAALRVLEGLA
jgi:hypothetical protein